MMKNRLFLGIFILFFGCEMYEQENYDELIVVEGYVVADQPLPEIFISTTVPAGTEYYFPDVAVKGAAVQVALLDDNNDHEEIFHYNASTSSPGKYLPESTHKIVPGRTYRLNVHFNNRSEEIEAETTIPDIFSILNEIPDTITYQSEEQLELVISAKQDLQSRNVYAINAIAQHPERNNLTPFYKKLVEENDSDPEDYIKNSTGLINEGSFNVNEDGTITLLFPWISVAFFEDTQVVVNSLDKNLSDFIRSQDVQLGGSTLPPGEIPNARYNIEGGIGVFGSLSTDTVATYFRRPE